MLATSRVSDALCLRDVTNVLASIVLVFINASHRRRRSFDGGRAGFQGLHCWRPEELWGQNCSIDLSAVKSLVLSVNSHLRQPPQAVWCLT